MPTYKQERPKQNVAAISNLFNQVMDDHKLRSDAQLAFFLRVAPPVISKMRGGTLPMGDSMVLKLHEHGGLSVARIRREIALKDDQQ